MPLVGEGHATVGRYVHGRWWVCVSVFHVTKQIIVAIVDVTEVDHGESCAETVGFLLKLEVLWNWWRRVVESVEGRSRLSLAPI